MLRFDEAPKKATNLSLNAKLLEAAREVGITNLSATVESLLADEVRRRYGEQWNVDNRQAIDAYNARVTREGTLSQRIRDRAAAAPSGDAAA